MFHKIKCPRCGVIDSKVPLEKYCSPKVICPVCSSIADMWMEESKPVWVNEYMEEEVTDAPKKKAKYSKG
jgi:uncharacterized Zn finger protein (UPF0148 family)